MHIISSNVTGADGAYSISAEPGYYGVTLQREGSPPAYAGEIHIASTDKPDTLNAFLDAPKDGDLRPEVMKRFEAMVNQVAAQSVQVSTDAASAAASAKAAKTSENAAGAAATRAEEFAGNAGESRDVAERAASSASGSADAAKASEVAAAKTLVRSLNPVTVTAPLTGTGKPLDPLSISTASQTAAGVVRLASDTETAEMTDETKAVTPSALAGVMNYFGGRDYSLLSPDLKDLNDAISLPVYILERRCENLPEGFSGTAVLMVFNYRYRLTQVLLGGGGVLCMRSRLASTWEPWVKMASVESLSAMGLMNTPAQTGRRGFINLNTFSASNPVTLFTNKDMVLRNWPVNAPSGTDATGAMWMIPSGFTDSVQILVTHSGKMFVRSQEGGNWLPWTQTGGEPVTGGIGTYVFAQCSVLASYGAQVSGSSLHAAAVGADTLSQDTTVFSGTWKCLGAVSAAGMASLFVRIA